MMKVIHIKADLGLNPNEKAYQCSVCGKVFNWDARCSWYGSYAQLEEAPKETKYFCSEKCKNEFNPNK